MTFFQSKKKKKGSGNIQKSLSYPPMGHLTFDGTGWVIFQIKNVKHLE